LVNITGANSAYGFANPLDELMGMFRPSLIRDPEKRREQLKRMWDLRREGKPVPGEELWTEEDRKLCYEFFFWDWAWAHNWSHTPDARKRMVDLLGEAERMDPEWGRNADIISALRLGFVQICEESDREETRARALTDLQEHRDERERRKGPRPAHWFDKNIFRHLKLVR